MLSRLPLVCVTVLIAILALWLCMPTPTIAQDTLPPTPIMQMAVIKPDTMPLLTQVELTTRLRSAEPGQSVPVAIRLPMTVTASVRALSNLTLQPQAPTAPVIRNWTKQLTETFETTFPPTDAACEVYDLSNDGLERFWDDDNARFHNGNWAAWPANGGADLLDPASNPYPANMDTFIACGPYDLSQMEAAYTLFWLWQDIPDPDDYVFFGVSGDGQTYGGLARSGVDQNWQPWKLIFSDYAGDDSVWVGWSFTSDADTEVGEGPWLDDVEIWAYDEPTKDCDALDLGNKGLNIPAYTMYYDQWIPIFSDPKDLDLVKVTGTQWVRLEFIAQEYGGINLRDYDMVIDSLCGQDIRTLALVDYRTLARTDWNDDPVGYRNAFTQTLQVLASHFQNRVDYWEIWNEEDHPTEASYQVEAEVYANLLKAAYETIKEEDSNAQVMLGGPYGIQWDSRDYVNSVYVAWGGQSYLDILGVHPYFFDPPSPFQGYVLDPQEYLYYDDSPYITTIDKFLKVMSDNGDSSKHIWATEVGWNSAYGDPNVGLWASQVVTKPLQAEYLTMGFDILFNEVTLWNQPSTLALDKVFWFAYADFNVEVALTDKAASHGWGRMSLQPRAPTALRPAHFGLYAERTRKPAFYHFWAYPQRPSFIFLPLVIRE